MALIFSVAHISTSFVPATLPARELVLANNLTQKASVTIHRWICDMMAIHWKATANLNQTRFLAIKSSYPLHRYPLPWAILHLIKIVSLCAFICLSESINIQIP